jgi:hypothetical protein
MGCELAEDAQVAAAAGVGESGGERFHQCGHEFACRRIAPPFECVEPLGALGVDRRHVPFDDRREQSRAAPEVVLDA